jgi:hypothetical protein
MLTGLPSCAESVANNSAFFLLSGAMVAHFHLTDILGEVTTLSSLAFQLTAGEISKEKSQRPFTTELASLLETNWWF